LAQPSTFWGHAFTPTPLFAYRLFLCGYVGETNRMYVCIYVCISVIKSAAPSDLSIIVHEQRVCSPL